MTEFENDWKQDPMDTYPNQGRRPKQHEDSVTFCMWCIVVIALILFSLYINEQNYGTIFNK